MNRHGFTAAVVLALVGGLLSGCKAFQDVTPSNPGGGPTWMAYTASNSGIVSNNVLSVAFDVQERDWFGTPSGASQLSGGKWTTFTTADGLAGNRVNAIASGRDGSLWFGTGGSGISRYNQNDVQQVWHTYGFVDGLPDAWIYSIAVDAYGDIWIGTNGGVGQFVQSLTDPRQGVWKSYGTTDGLPEVHVVAAAVDMNNTKWFGTPNSGLASYDGNSWLSYPLPQGNLYHVTSLAIDKANTKWVGTWNGAVRFDGKSWASYDTSSGLAGNFVNAVAVQSGSIVWFGTLRGATSFDGTHWTTYNTANSSIVSDTITAIAVDTKSNVWFATPLGVSVFNQNGIL